jgi:hypothetical protein
MATTTTTTTTTTLNAKIRCGDDVRRVPLHATDGLALEELMAKLVIMFNLDGMNHGGSFRIKYQDDEGDLVSITDDDELQAAFALAKDWGAYCFNDRLPHCFAAVSLHAHTHYS